MRNDLLDESLLGSSTPNWDSKTITRINDVKIELNTHLKPIKRGRMILYALVGLGVFGIIVSSFFNSYDVNTAEMLIEGLVLTIIYGFSATLFTRNPLVAMSIPLGVYLLLQILTAVVAPETLINGILFKIIIVAGLGSGVYAAIEAKRHLKQLKGCGVPKEELENYFSKLEPVPKTLRPKKPKA